MIFPQKIVTLIMIIATVTLLLTAGVGGGQASSGAALQAQTTITLNAIADATIKSWQPDTNFGNEGKLQLSYSKIDNPKTAVSLLQFDVANALPDGATIDSAKLKLYLLDGNGADPTSTIVHLVTGGWQENLVNWNSRPTTKGFGVAAQVDTKPEYKLWDVTGFAQTWQTGSNNGIELSAPTSGAQYERTFGSREHQTYPAQLEVTYHTLTPLPTPTDTPTPTSTPPPGLDLQVEHVELTQVIQCKDNPKCPDNVVPLIAGKTTYARVYVKVVGSDKPVANVSAQLTVKMAGWEYTAVSLNPTITAQTKPDRANFKDTLNFWLDPRVVNYSTTLEVEVNPNQTIAESNYTNNKKMETLNFVTTPPLNIAPIWLEVQNKTGQWETVDQWMPFHMNQYLENLMPVGDVNWIIPAYPYKRWNKTIGPGGASWGEILTYLGDRRNKSSVAQVGDIHYYGLVPVGVPQGTIAGYGYLPGKVAAGRVPVKPADLEDGADILVHELGHNFGRGHTPCNVSNPDPNYPYPNAVLGDYGWDPQGAAGGRVRSLPDGWIVPQNRNDVLSYCQDEWISEYTYRGILNFRGSIPASNNRTSQSQAKVRETVQTGRSRQLVPHLFVSGNILNGQLDLSPFSILDKPVNVDRPANFADDPDPGQYKLQLIAVSGEILFERYFDPQDSHMLRQPGALATSTNHTDDDLHFFYEVLPWFEETERIRLWHEGDLLAERLVSNAAPTVDLISPQPGAVWANDGSYTISWSAQDGDDDPLWFDVAFSSDGGLSWDFIATQLTESSFEIDGKDFPGTDIAMIRVLASDGVLTSEDISDKYSIESKLPGVMIILPQEDSVIPVGMPVILEALGYDREDGMLSDETMSWWSDLDGPIGNGAEIVTPSLSPGQHTITLQATDSDGNEASVSVTIVTGHRVYLPLLMR